MNQDTRATSLAAFATWGSDHLIGDEKGEAQLFLDRLFQAFGWGGVREAGATLEARIKKEKGGTSFADLLWKPIVLIEMKKRGEDLSKHYRQAFDYWTRLVPGRPRWVVLCNFDEFWVYDFETQMDTPLDKLRLEDLPQRYGPLAFLFPGNEKPVFGNDQESVTRQAADILSTLFNQLLERGIERPTAQRFILQSLMCLFAEDIGLLEKYFFARLLQDCASPADTWDLIGGLFDAMNTPGRTSGGRFKGVDYFNGGLFAVPARIELNAPEIELLRQAASYDWSQVRPEIFGTLFQHSIGAQERHASGAHFTTAADIMKIVGPTIVEPWREQIESAKTLKRLEELLLRLEHFRVLDPACGSGNFLYLAYRELKRIEARIYQRIGEFPSRNAAQRPFGFVTARNFYGMDIQPFAVELAKVTMMLAHKLAIDELHVTENALPLDNLDANFIIGDALIAPGGGRTVWPAADIIIGNPPFLGAKRLKPEHGADYVNKVRKLYPEVPGMADYCVYWFRRAHEHLPACTADDPVSGRAGLVGTQNVRNNASREGGLDAICRDGTVIEAVDNQPWSGDANVHVSIANWVKTQDAALLPEKRRLWFKMQSPPLPRPLSRQGRGEKKPIPLDGGGVGERVKRADKSYELDFREVAHINSALSDQTDVTGAVRLTCNYDPQVCFSGQVTGHDGFILEPRDAVQMITTDSRNSEVIHPFLIGRDMLTGSGNPSEWVIDFQTRSVLEASSYAEPFAHVQRHVLPTREQKAEEGKTTDGEQRSHHKQFLRYWWRHSFDRPEMISLLGQSPRYIVCSDTTKRPVFVFIARHIRPDHKLRVFAFADDYSFGILQSHAHWLWFVTKCSKLKSDYNYTSSTVFDTFPWPQASSDKHIDAIAAAGRDIRRIRAEALQSLNGGLRALYRTLDLPGKNPLRDAHTALDQAVLAAYGFDPKADLLAQLLQLNRATAARIENGEPVTAPGLPPAYPDPARMVTEDCIGK